MLVPKLTLVYFPICGHAEPIRLAAVLGKIPFTNKAIECAEWSTVKASLPLGQVPVLEVGDDNDNKTIFNQSHAILRYVGKLSGHYPTDELQAMQVDALLDSITASMMRFVVTVENAPSMLISDEPWPQEKILEMRTFCDDTS